MTKTQEERLQKFLNLRLMAEETSINHMMQMRFVKQEKNQITLAFPVAEWQLNPMGVMHGGMLATVADICMGCASYTFSDTLHSPTVALNLQYLRPVLINQDLYMTAKIDHLGSRIIQLHAWGWQQQEEEPCITATGSYMINR